jgi:hypothetical protein
MKRKAETLGVLESGSGFKQIYAVYSVDGISPTITTAASHGNGMPFILEIGNEKGRDCHRNA